MNYFKCFLMAIVFLSCSSGTDISHELLYPFEQQGRMNGAVKSMALSLIDETVTTNDNVFATVFSADEVALWTFYGDSNQWYLKINYINRERNCTYVTRVDNPTQWLENSDWQAVEMADEFPFILDGASSIFKNKKITLYAMPWPWWLIDSDDFNEKHIVEISNDFLRNDIYYMYHYVFDRRICPFSQTINNNENK